MASRYFVGNGTDWNSTTSWAATSGGASGASVPVSTDDVFFDANSPGNCTISVAANCRSADFTGFAYTLTHNAGINWNIGAASLPASGVTLKLVSGMTYTTGNSASTIVFIATSAAGQGTIDAGTKTLGSISFTQNGSWKMLSGFTATGTVTFSNGTLDLNGLTYTWGTFNGQGANARTLTGNGANITITGGNASVWNCSGQSGLTISLATTTITLSGASAAADFGSLSYGTVVFSGSGTARINDANTFVNLTRTGTAVTTDQFQIIVNQTITGTLTLNGNSSVNRIFVSRGAGNGVATVQLTAAATVLNNVLFQDVVALGAASWSGTLIGNAGGNSGITFTPSATQTWTAGSGGSWITNTWSGGRMPLPQDDVIITGAFSGSTNITFDAPYMGRNIDFTGTTGSPNITVSTSSVYFGNFTLVAGVGTFTFSAGALIYQGRTTSTFTSSGKTLSGTGITFYLSTPGGTLQFGDTFSSAGTIWLQGGTLSGNGQSATFATIAVGGSVWSTATLSLGTGTWTGTSTGNVWNMSTHSAITNSTGSTIAFTDTSATSKSFLGGGFTYGNFMVSGGGTGAVIITGANTFSTITIGGPKTFTLPSSVTNTCTNLVINSSAGNVVTINASTVGTKATLSCSNVVNVDYISVTDNTAAGNTPFYAGRASHSTLSNATNWNMSVLSANTTINQTSAPSLHVQVSGHPILTQSESLQIVKALNRTIPTVAESTTPNVTANQVRSFSASQGEVIGVDTPLISKRLAININESPVLSRAEARTIIQSINTQESVTHISTSILATSQSEIAFLSKLSTKNLLIGQSEAISLPTRAIFRALSIPAITNPKLTIARPVSITTTQGEAITLKHGQIHVIITTQAESISLSRSPSTTLVIQYSYLELGPNLLLGPNTLLGGQKGQPEVPVVGVHPYRVLSTIATPVAANVFAPQRYLFSTQSTSAKLFESPIKVLVFRQTVIPKIIWNVHPWIRLPTLPDKLLIVRDIDNIIITYVLDQSGNVSGTEAVLVGDFEDNYLRLIEGDKPQYNLTDTNLELIENASGNKLIVVSDS